MFQSAVAMVKDSYYIGKVGLSTLFKTLQSEVFRTLPVHRFLWGYKDDLVDLAKPFLQMSTQIPAMEQFGILATVSDFSYLSTNGTTTTVGVVLREAVV